MEDATHSWVGYIAAAIAVVGFGSCFVPVKKFETGDGLFFQWVVCIAIWMCGLVINLIRGLPKFEPLAMLGGFLWCTGNITVVPIIQMIGYALGIVLWDCSNLLVGWLSGAVPLFGLNRDVVPGPVFNYLGAGIALISIPVYSIVQSTTSDAKKPPPATDVEGGDKDASSAPLLSEKHVQLESTSDPLQPNSPFLKYLDGMSKRKKQVVGITLALLSGIMYGTSFDPPQYLIDHNNNGEHSTNGLDYVFSHFCGILVGSTFYLVVYALISRNKPVLYPKVLLPGLITGLLWAISYICWFVANTNLSLVVSFPIITTGPSVVAALWGVIAFKEIRGRRNFVWLGIAFFLTLLGVAFITLSHEVTT